MPKAYPAYDSNPDTALFQKIKRERERNRKIDTLSKLKSKIQEPGNFIKIPFVSISVGEVDGFFAYK